MSYPHQPGSPSFEGGAAYEAYCNEQEGRLMKAAQAVVEDVCGLLCPSHWETAKGRPPHHRKCIELRAALAEPPTTMVYCVRCIEGSGFDAVHIFSTPDRAAAFAESDPRDHVLSDYVIDCPERMEERSQ